MLLGVVDLVVDGWAGLIGIWGVGRGRWAVSTMLRDKGSGG
jgi:hypothetical protein